VPGASQPHRPGVLAPPPTPPGSARQGTLHRHKPVPPRPTLGIAATSACLRSCRTEHMFWYHLLEPPSRHLGIRCRSQTNPRRARGFTSVTMLDCAAWRSPTIPECRDGGSGMIPEHMFSRSLRQRGCRYRELARRTGVIGGVLARGSGGGGEVPHSDGGRRLARTASVRTDGPST